MINERVFLLPGDYHLTRKPKEIGTLLGSCVSVCLLNRKNGFAAMNHYLLDAAPAGVPDIGRYGDTSIGKIVDALFKFDATPSNYHARIFGGGEVVGHLSAGQRIGERNIAKAREVLAARRIEIVEEDVGGKKGRRIKFDTGRDVVECAYTGQSKEAAELARQRTAKATGPIKVLIVDDSALVRKALRMVVESAGDMIVLDEAADAYEARSRILSLNPDVVTLDIIMPKLDGLQFLKKLSMHFPLPVVVVSTIAKDRSDVARRAREYGAVDVVDKETLDLYGGIGSAREILLPKLRSAAFKVVRKGLFAV